MKDKMILVHMTPNEVDALSQLQGRRLKFGGLPIASFRDLAPLLGTDVPGSLSDGSVNKPSVADLMRNHFFAHGGLVSTDIGNMSVQEFGSRLFPDVISSHKAGDLVTGSPPVGSPRVGDSSRGDSVGVRKGVRYLREHGRGRDTEIVALPQSVSDFFDTFHGGPVINPYTGLKEYGFLDFVVRPFVNGAISNLTSRIGGWLGENVGGVFGNKGKDVGRFVGNIAGGALGSHAGNKLVSTAANPSKDWTQTIGSDLRAGGLKPATEMAADRLANSTSLGKYLNDDRPTLRNIARGTGAVAGAGIGGRVAGLPGAIAGGGSGYVFGDKLGDVAGKISGKLGSWASSGINALTNNTPANVTVPSADGHVSQIGVNKSGQLMGNVATPGATADYRGFEHASPTQMVSGYMGSHARDGVISPSQTGDSAVGITNHNTIRKNEAIKARDSRRKDWALRDHVNKSGLQQAGTSASLMENGERFPDIIDPEYWERLARTDPPTGGAGTPGAPTGGLFRRGWNGLRGLWG